MSRAEWLTLPLTVFSGLGFEWRVHKSLLHRRVPGFGSLYERHERQHHVAYTGHDMAMRSRREWYLVLMPAYGIALVFVLLMPIAVGLWWLLTPNVALLHVAASMLVFLGYEWSHLTYHLPENSALGRLALVRWLCARHRLHHDPRRMKHWNFNVTIPVFDWIHGSAWSDARARARGHKA